MFTSNVALITGCASGIGLATTQLFLSKGYQVFGVDISDMDLGKLDNEAKDRFGFHKVDLTMEGACDEVVKLCTEKFGEKINVLANVAGIMDAFATADTFTDGEWEKVIMINVTVPTRLIRAVLPAMKKNKSGSIINIASKAALSGAAAGVAYTASKHALLGVTKNTAWRFRDEGIRCNAIMPGATLTNISSSMQQQNWDMAAYQKMMPVHHLHVGQGEPAVIEPIEIANAIAFLASPESRFINGVSMPVDKAWSVV